jgi:hypothetical protein
MMRGFTDSTGTSWRVWEVFPTRAEVLTTADTFSRSSLKETPFANGWLCFESSETKRRLAPIPSGWEFGTDDALEQLCQQAAVVPLRRAGRFTA